MVLEFLSLSTTLFSGMIKRQDLLGRQNACHMYNPVKICCPPLGMHTRKINLEIKKCIFKGETSFSYLLNPTVLIFWTLESRTLKQLQLDCPLRQADTYIESWSFRTLSLWTLSISHRQILLTIRLPVLHTSRKRNSQFSMVHNWETSYSYML